MMPGVVAAQWAVLPGEIDGVTGSVSLLSIAVLNPPIGWLVDGIGTFVPNLMVVGCMPLLGAMIGLSYAGP